MPTSPLDAPLLVLANMPDQELAAVLARNLVERSLAACVNMMPAVSSVYRWQGKVEHATEIPLLIKTTQARYSELE